jgi:hypothetical protein
VTFHNKLVACKQKACAGQQRSDRQIHLLRAGQARLCSDYNRARWEDQTRKAAGECSPCGFQDVSGTLFVPRRQRDCNCIFHEVGNPKARSSAQDGEGPETPTTRHRSLLQARQRSRRQAIFLQPVRMPSETAIRSPAGPGKGCLVGNGELLFEQSGQVLRLGEPSFGSGWSRSALKPAGGQTPRRTVHNTCGEAAGRESPRSPCSPISWLVSGTFGLAAWIHEPASSGTPGTAWRCSARSPRAHSPDRRANGASVQTSRSTRFASDSRGPGIRVPFR